MTRKEYEKMAISKSSSFFVSNVVFSILLREMAISLFVDGDLESEFALETKRRLIQLEERGYTDD